ncbi:hypothetical protein OJF2_38020 [Aquisphaera giovannonii]|uniref:Bacterial Ig-like domain-containing protein n=1 Tax=Aquisphaera giovannonii TaxID=406548 RepID=A0A5B9W504_9BACT|nr:hypothetical protein [Aquisphaera giovannonii]QEH35254.1 hypothetical protein OJF2_38020 [Aquisphaera giovannonii]
MNAGRFLDLFRALRRSSRAPRRRPRACSPAPLGLEARIALSGAGVAPPLTMLSATTADSKGVTVTYRVDTPTTPTFRVYRSADPGLDAGDSLVGGYSAQATTADDAGNPAGSVGTHTLTIPLPGGLPISPSRPYVLVVAGDAPTAAAGSADLASFRKFSIAVVTHGALINGSWKYGPPWELSTAKVLQREGFDAVLPFNWAYQSGQPGKAPAQGPRLAGMIREMAESLPAGSPIDLQLIGHSEGNVVNTQAIVALEGSMPPGLRAGYLVETMLDPHAASNNVPGQASERSGLLGSLARSLVRDYQGRANDPPAYVPAGVDAAQVFYQHSKAEVHNQIYNLWGQVPVANLGDAPIAYYNLTAAGAVHSGRFGVSLWYRNFVAPTLAEQSPLIRELTLTGSVEGGTTVASPAATPGLAANPPAARRAVAWGTTRALASGSVTFSGTAAPGSQVRVYMGPAADPSTIAPAGRTTADASGRWTFTRPALAGGTYRAVAMSYARGLQTRPGLAIVPMTPLGRFTASGRPRDGA